MTLPLEQAQNIAELMRSGLITNLFAQSDAKHVLYEVHESPDSFPAFDSQLEEKVTYTAYSLLAAGCSMLEQRSENAGILVLEKAASLLQNVHHPFIETSRESCFHVLISSMAFYAAGHFSRAFVEIGRVENSTMVARIIAGFIRKDIKKLVTLLNEVLLRDTPQFINQIDLDEWAITLAIARSISNILEFIITGSENNYNDANRTLEDASIIADSGFSSAHWWIIRLLRLMLRNLKESSLWNNLPPLFNQEAIHYLKKFIRLLAFGKSPVIELWASQRSALPLALNEKNRGGVINLRTSSGKTLVAELAILQTLCNDPTARIIYLAPFKSLAFELEKKLSESFSWLGFHVSHLYGGSRVSSVDNKLVKESSITIATPEKTRALFRAFPGLSENVRLFIIDEGHLIGPSERYVKNELFIDHLRAITRSSNARILLLSAVLPNPQELATWVGGDQGALAISEWKPSAERFGLLKWNGKRVRIDWLGEVDSFNPSFVKAVPVNKREKSRLFPATKSEAVAAASVRLSNLGPVMIFVAQARWISSMANSVLRALGNEPQEHQWPEHEWRVFNAVCNEELGPDSVEFRSAKFGIICHSNNLPPQVRLSMEVLMRSYASKIIIATTTLAQGVNIGISSVIINTPWIGNKKKLDKRDFWNICGRAGRAFIDGEGKILYAIDETKKLDQIIKDEKLARLYFDTKTTDRIESGLLYCINILRQIADYAGISFETLIEMVANNDFSKVEAQREHFEAILDLIDDELLAFHEDTSINQSDNDSIDWVDQAFRESLAAIQASLGPNQSNANDVILFLKARVTFTLRNVPDKSTRQSIVASGLPMSVAIKAHRDLELFRKMADEYLDSHMLLSDLTCIVQKIEMWARENADSVTEDMPEESKLDNLREKWLEGVSLQDIMKQDSDAVDICKDLYGYQLPWIINAIAQKLDKKVEEKRISTLARIALLVEIGVSTELAALLFLAGIYSRVAATELSRLNVQFGDSVYEIKQKLLNINFVNKLIPKVTTPTADWLKLLRSSNEYFRKTPLPSFAPFKLKVFCDKDTLYARKSGDKLFLCSSDGSLRIRIKPSERWRFDEVADDPRFAFKKLDEVWRIISRDPRVV